MDILVDEGQVPPVTTCRKCNAVVTVFKSGYCRCPQCANEWWMVEKIRTDWEFIHDYTRFVSKLQERFPDFHPMTEQILDKLDVGRNVAKKKRDLYKFGTPEYQANDIIQEGIGRKDFLSSAQKVD